MKSTKLDKEEQDNNSKLNTWCAILAWRDHIYLSDKYLNITKINYISAMVRLIQEGFIKPRMKVECMTEEWQKQTADKIDKFNKWLPSTRSVRKSCLKSFYKFVLKYNLENFKEHAFQEIPPIEVIFHILTSINEKVKAIELAKSDWVKIFDTIKSESKRDYLICFTMWFTARSVVAILDLKKTILHSGHLSGSSIKFKDGDSQWIPTYLMELLKSDSENNKEYLFETKKHKKVFKNQIVRRLKKASQVCGLQFQITPKILLSVSAVYLEMDKRSYLEKVFCDIKNS